MSFSFLNVIQMGFAVLLKERFEGRLIKTKCDIEWAPHSPDV